MDTIADWVMAQDAAPLVYSSADPDVLRLAQDQFGADKIAHAIGDIFARLAANLQRKGLRRLIVAGGETSGAVVTGRAAQTLTIGPRAAAGVPLVRSGNMALALKSGNFGVDGEYGLSSEPCQHLLGWSMFPIEPWQAAL